MSYTSHFFFSSGVSKNIQKREMRSHLSPKACDDDNDDDDENKYAGDNSSSFTLHRTSSCVVVVSTFVSVTCSDVLLRGITGRLMPFCSSKRLDGERDTTRHDDVLKDGETTTSKSRRRRLARANTKCGGIFTVYNVRLVARHTVQRRCGDDRSVVSSPRTTEFLDIVGSYRREIVSREDGRAETFVSSGKNAS